MGQYQKAYNYLLSAKQLLSETSPDYDINFIEIQLDAAIANMKPGFDKPGAI